MSGQIVTAFPATDVKSIRVRNRAEIRNQTDERRTRAVQNVVERLDAFHAAAVYRAVEHQSVLSAAEILRRAIEIVNAVNAFMRGGSELE